MSLIASTGVFIDRNKDILPGWIHLTEARKEELVNIWKSLPSGDCLHRVKFKMIDLEHSLHR